MAKGKDSKPHIGIFGRRNYGKSSLINALTGQQVAIVSEVPGTTTDPVKKSVEIFGIGPAILIDTAGIDDEGSLGNLRIKKTHEVIPLIDMAMLVITGGKVEEWEKKLMDIFRKQAIPFFLINNKADLFRVTEEELKNLKEHWGTDVVNFSAKTRQGLDEVIALMRKHTPENTYRQTSMLAGLIKPGDVVVLVTPIDSEAPEGRLILPQVQTIRDVLDNDGVAVVLKEDQTARFLRDNPIKPALVISDSQVILKTCKDVPENIPTTGFSILLAHYKGDFKNYLKGTPSLKNLKDGDKILILESCTHQVSCDDIGRVKIPRWISQFTNKKLSFRVVAGTEKIPDDISQYAMVIQCGGCVLTKRQIINRLKPAVEAGVPVSNYGMTIAFVNGVYDRVIQPFIRKDEEKNE